MLTQPRRVAPLILLALLMLTALVACGGDSADEAETPNAGDVNESSTPSLAEEEDAPTVEEDEPAEDEAGEPTEEENEPTVEEDESAEEMEAETPEGLTDYETSLFTIALPEEWEVVDLSAEDREAIFEDLQENNPEFAEMLGSPAALADMDLMALDLMRADFAPNLNIRHTEIRPGESITISELLAELMNAYEEEGFDIKDHRDDLDIGGLPTGVIVFELPEIQTASGAMVVAIGEQYLVLGEESLWYLTYSTTTEQRDELIEMVRQSAQSFRPQ